MSDKTALRKATWQALIDSGDARFPGTLGRIPNFKGAEAAADRLAATEAFQRATRVKCNPDSPHRPVRHRVLKAGKVLVMAVPKLADERAFWILDPEELAPEQLWPASSIRGAAKLGRPATPEEVGHIDLICTGCVAVTQQGARLGKGGGYSDLEYAVLRELQLVQPDTPIWTTVHPVQILPDGTVPMQAHDISLDGFCTPEQTVVCERAFERPTGVDRVLLPAEKLQAIPILGTP
ncbi:MAG: 5-formyltetrahydrofolate cyclo-ligase [Myxococcales bacterium]|nr:5-formyltetrahydrofolate cyclo-ligase [Myxococcales bacterium]